MRFLFSSCFTLFCLLAPIIYFLYALGCFPGFHFLINILFTVFIHQKNKKKKKKKRKRVFLKENIIFLLHCAYFNLFLEIC